MWVLGQGWLERYQKESGGRVADPRQMDSANKITILKQLLCELFYHLPWEEMSAQAGRQRAVLWALSRPSLYLCLRTAFRGVVLINQQFTAFFLDPLNCCVLNDWILIICHGSSVCSYFLEMFAP